MHRAAAMRPGQRSGAAGKAGGDEGWPEVGEAAPLLCAARREQCGVISGSNLMVC